MKTEDSQKQDDATNGGDARDCPPSPGSAPTRQEWLKRCAARFREVAEVEPDLAMSLAESQLENLNDDLTESPEDAAYDEMSYWGED